jgi:hypothetical protein
MIIKFAFSFYSVLVHLSLFLLLPSLSILYKLYFFQHSKYLSCKEVNKSNNASEGQVTTNETSVLLKNLLPYSYYSVMVAAHTIEYGTDAKITGHTPELGNVFSDM